MNILNEIKQILTSEESFYGMVEAVEETRVWVSSMKGGQWYEVTGFSVGDRVFIRGDRVEKSSFVAEGNIFSV